ncbi:MAG: hypothetical protein KIH08_15765 [Candidatus Freyarchaeota archaeon]|nr:hypothetical protein [Candidatus Jordarchaeia archaeon]
MGSYLKAGVIAGVIVGLIAMLNSSPATMYCQFTGTPFSDPVVRKIVMLQWTVTICLVIGLIFWWVKSE